MGISQILTCNDAVQSFFFFRTHGSFARHNQSYYHLSVVSYNLPLSPILINLVRVNKIVQWWWNLGKNHQKNHSNINRAGYLCTRYTTPIRLLEQSGGAIRKEN